MQYYNNSTNSDNIKKFDNLYEAEQIDGKEARAIQKAYDKHKPKTFYQDFKSVYNASNVLNIVFSILSCILAYGFFYSIFKDTFSSAVAYSVTILFVALFEVGKNSMLKMFFYFLFRGKTSKSLAPLLVSVCFVLISAYSSVIGIEQQAERMGKEKLSDSTHALINETNGQIEALDKKIQLAEKDLKDFKKSVSWKGHIDTRNKPSMSIMESKQKAIDLLLMEKKNIITKSDTTIQNTQHTIIVGNNKTRNNAMMLAGINELLIILTGGFCVYFFYGIYAGNGNQLATEKQPKSNQKTTGDNDNSNDHTGGFGEIFKRINLPNLNDNSNTNKIGFHQSNIRDCRHCGKGFEYNSKKHVYCSASCRSSAYTERTGKTLGVPKDSLK